MPNKTLHVFQIVNSRKQECQYHMNWKTHSCLPYHKHFVSHDHVTKSINSNIDWNSLMWSLYTCIKNINIVITEREIREA